MVTCVIDYVAGDTGTIHGPVTCKDKAGTVIDLTGGSAKLLYRMDGGSLQTKTMTVNSPATSGNVQYQFLSGELIAGEMVGEIEVTDSGNKIITEICTFTRAIRAKI